MNNIYIKTKTGIKEIIHVDDAAKTLNIKPSTLSAYMAREQFYLKKVHIKNLVFFYKEDLDKLLEFRKENKKNSQPMVELFKI